jgi:H+/gluconate symporter-like permease
VAAVSALALLLIMAMDWYGSHEADRARQVQSGVTTSGAGAGEVARQLSQDAQSVIARDEKNAWQEQATIDRVTLAFLLLTVLLPLVAATLRAQGRRFEPPWTPSAFTAVSAAITALLVAYRIVQQPGPDSMTTLKVGPALALIALAALGIGAAAAFQKEADWAAMREAARKPEPPPES